MEHSCFREYTLKLFSLATFFAHPLEACILVGIQNRYEIGSKQLGRGSIK